jgi:hypothetical protein
VGDRLDGAGKALQREARYVRGQLVGLAEHGSQQRFEVRQIGKATLAAALAWLLAYLLMPHEAVWIAPATAVIMVHATVYRTLTNGLARVSAVAAGVILAGSVGYLLGLNALSLILIVPPALIADGAESRRFNLRRLARPASDCHPARSHPARSHQVRGHQVRLHHAPVVKAMSRIGVHLHAIVRVLGYIAQQHDDEGCPPQISDEFAHDYAALLDVLAQALQAQLRFTHDPDELSTLLSTAREHAGAIHQQMTDQVRTGHLDRPQGWAATGSLLTDAEHITTILGQLLAKPAPSPHPGELR